MSRRCFIAGATALAGMGLNAGARPAFGFDRTKCQIDPKFANHPLFSGEPVCGVNFGFLAKRGYFSRPEVKAMPRKMRESGANWCILNTHFCQEAFFTRKLFFDPVYSSGEAELTEIVKRLQGEGLHVILKPCLTTLDGTWMGQVNFEPGGQLEGVHTSEKYWPEWFGSFREVLKCFAGFSARNGIDAVLVGAEYTGTVFQDEEWRKTIAAFRKEYDGPLAYEFVRNPEPNGAPVGRTYADWYAKIPFIDALDFLALSWYPRARPFDGGIKPNMPKTSLQEMVDYLRPAREQFDKTLEMYGKKPVLFTETGIRSSRGCVALPWDGGSMAAKGECDLQEQADYMEAVFQTFSVKPQWAGLCWWKWDETQTREYYNPDPKKDRGFTIEGKPACDVFRRWSGRS